MKCISKLLIISFLIVLASCSSTQLVTINTMEPAKIDLSNKILRVGVLNGVGYIDKSIATKGIDRLIAIEDQWLISKGQDAAVHALVEELKKDSRFEVEALDAFEDGTDKIEINSNELSWKEIKAICDKHNIDALFSLTHFDAETSVSFKKTKMEQVNMMREKESVSAQEITLETLIENGWRIYDPTLGVIIDEYTDNQQIVSKAKGTDPVAALRAIGSRKESMLSKGKLTGNSYGERLKPSEHKIIREYFVKGTNKLIQAGKSMSDGDLKSATALWKEETSNSKSKIKGRAFYNLAVGEEIGGDLHQAIAWATKAKESLNDKGSQSYLSELENLLIEQMIVEGQLAHLNFVD